MIQRYEIAPVVDGQWCKASDVAELEAENERLKAARHVVINNGAPLSKNALLMLQEIQEFTDTPNGDTATKALANIASACHLVLEATSAQNHVLANIGVGNQTFWLTVRREDGESPEEQLWPAKERVAELEAENERLKNSRDSFKGLFEQSCAHVAEACEMLGVDPKETPADTWALREAASKRASHKWVPVEECGEPPGINNEGTGGVYVVFNGFADRLHEREVSGCECEAGVGWCLDTVSHVLCVNGEPVKIPEAE